MNDQTESGCGFDLEMQIHGSSRKASIYVPGGYDRNHAWPLVFAFHPFLQPNVSWERYVEMRAAAERHRFLCAMPRGTGWLCFRSFRNDPVTRPNKPDDHAFVVSLLEEIASRFSVDRSRIYAIGHSNGGMFSHALAATHPSLLAGFVSVSGPPATSLSDRTAPTPVMMVHGTTDRITPWDGPSRRTPKFARYIDVDTILGQWLQINRATGEPVVSLYDRPSDRTRILRYDWPAPPAEAETVVLKIENGGHRWPDLERKIYYPFTGNQSQDIDMLDVAWEFLSRQRLQFASSKLP